MRPWKDVKKTLMLVSMRLNENWLYGCSEEISFEMFGQVWFPVFIIPFKAAHAFAMWMLTSFEIFILFNIDTIKVFLYQLRYFGLGRWILFFGIYIKTNDLRNFFDASRIIVAPTRWKEQNNFSIFGVLKLGLGGFCGVHSEWFSRYLCTQDSKVRTFQLW